MAKERLNIAIDGPAGAGKSTVAKLLASRLGIRYLDTGAMYRAMALFAFRNGVDPKDREGMLRILDNADITVRYAEDGSQHVLLAGEDVTDMLRTPELGMGASNVGLHPPVRQKLAALQRQVGVDYDVVMDGREITTFVLPHTKHKFYLTASVEERARRRLGELRQRGDTETTLAYIAADIEKRDKNDMEREYMPLRIAEDAEVVDTTNMTIDEVLAYMLQRIAEKQEDASCSM